MQSQRKNEHYPVREASEIQRLIERHGGYLWGCCYRRCSGEPNKHRNAEELFWTVLAKVCKRAIWPPLESDIDWTKWLSTIARNARVDRTRRSKRFMEFKEDYAVRVAAKQRKSQAKQHRETMAQAVARLLETRCTQEERLVAQLKAERFTFAKIGTKLRIAPSTARRRFAAVKAKLRTAMRSEGWLAA